VSDPVCLHGGDPRNCSNCDIDALDAINMNHEGVIARLTRERDEARAKAEMTNRCAKCDAEWLTASVNGVVGPCPFCVAAELQAEVAGLNEMIAALEERDRWPPCACCYDAPGDVCAVHSPRLAPLEAEVERLTKALRGVLEICDGSPVPNDAAGLAIERARAILDKSGGGK
jgi:cell division FtsZ-interacting protein ZapD